MEASTALLDAIRCGDRATVERLIRETPALVHTRDQHGVSAVLLAAYYQEPAISYLLREHGAELDIFTAAALGDVARVQALLGATPSCIDAYAGDGFQPLGLAAFFGQTEVVRVLLTYGAAVNAPSHNPQRVMPLHSAVAGQHLAISQLLIEHGADVNAVQADDFTPLQEAAQNGQIAMIDLLLDHGADCHAANQQGQTAYDIAQAHGHAEAAARLKREDMRPYET